MPIEEKVIERCNLRLGILIPQYKNGIQSEDLDLLEKLILDIDPLMKILNKKSQLLELKNALFEIAINKERYKYAIDGLIVNRRLTNKRTRLYLEATTLLAIAYLRLNDVSSAKPFITEVLQRPNVIKSDATRKKFNEEIIKRFDEEAAYYSLKNSNVEKIDTDKITKEALNAVNSDTEEDLFKKLGYITPKNTKNILFEVHQFSKKQLTYEEQKLLISPESLLSNEKAGKTIFSSFKRVIYNLICDPKSEIYQKWKSNIVGSIFDRTTFVAVISGALAANGIGHIMLVCIAAIILKQGFDMYCKQYKPVRITELRRKS